MQPIPGNDVIDRVQLIELSICNSDTGTTFHPCLIIKYRPSMCKKPDFFNKIDFSGIVIEQDAIFLLMESQLWRI